MSAAARSRPAPAPSTDIRPPVMKVTQYDRISSGLISMTMGLCVLVMAAVLYWLSTRVDPPEFLIPLEMVEIEGGFPDGNPDETLKVESPEDPLENPSPAEELLDEQQLTDLMDNVVELADVATLEANKVEGELDDLSGEPGSANGTGGRPLGSGKRSGGIPNEQRWFIQYADEVSLPEYAKQLDFFGIELGALQTDGKLIYLSKVSTNTPVKREANSGKDESRLYMTWQGGNRKDADRKLFERVGLNVTNAILFHFYPPATEQLLLRKEYEHAKRKATEIRRTYFSVNARGGRYEYVVVRQTYLR